MKINVFNTNRLYTAMGQRIAYTVLKQDAYAGSIVGMVDCDRMIDYMLVVYGPVTDKSVLEAYDKNRTLGWDEELHSKFSRIKKKLSQCAAEQTPFDDTAAPGVPMYEKYDTCPFCENDGFSVHTAVGLVTETDSVVWCSAGKIWYDEIYKGHKLVLDL